MRAGKNKKMKPQINAEKRRWDWLKAGLGTFRLSSPVPGPWFRFPRLPLNSSAVIPEGGIKINPVVRPVPSTIAFVASVVETATSSIRSHHPVPKLSRASSMPIV